MKERKWPLNYLRIVELFMHVGGVALEAMFEVEVSELLSKRCDV